MGATYFASDVHLTAVDDSVFDRFVSFCSRVRDDGQSLFLLGDVFEAYLGDDDDHPLLEAVCTELRGLVDAGIALAFAHGNRDFLVGPQFAARAGLRVMDAVEVTELGSRRAVLLHGDTLCTDDLPYQTIRRQLRDPAWQAQFLAQPLSARRAFAAQARARSAAHTANAAAEIMDVNGQAVTELFEQTAADWIVHGHTHRPALHQNDRQQRRIVLGDWPREASWLRVDEKGGAALHFDGKRVDIE